MEIWLSKDKKHESCAILVPKQGLDSVNQYSVYLTTVFRSLWANILYITHFGCFNDQNSVGTRNTDLHNRGPAKPVTVVYRRVAIIPRIQILQIYCYFSIDKSLKTNDCC